MIPDEAEETPGVGSAIRTWLRHHRQDADEGRETPEPREEGERERERLIP